MWCLWALQIINPRAKATLSQPNIVHLVGILQYLAKIVNHGALLEPMYKFRCFLIRLAWPPFFFFFGETVEIELKTGQKPILQQ